jgi:RimJ/RimL family protein N-acetyltransferase
VRPDLQLRTWRNEALSQINQAIGILSGGIVRIYLKPVVSDDLEWLINNRNIPVLYKNFNQATPITFEQQLHWFQNEILNKKAFAYIIYLGKIKLGYIALQNINWIIRSAEISHFILEDYNEFFALYAHDVILKMAFLELNLNRVYSLCFCANEIYKELEKLGFKVEGTARQTNYKNGKYGDSYYVAVLKDEFKSISG